jgi:RNA polymerase sigma factor (sigma-70 family)
LEQARRNSRVSLANSRSQLSPADQAQVRQILENKWGFVDNEAFYEAGAEQTLLYEPEPLAKPDTSWYHPVMDNISEVRGVKNVTAKPLTAEQERTLFLQFNYTRYRVDQLREKLGTEVENIDADTAREMLKWYRRSEELRDQIAQTNLALVLAMAKRTRMSEVDFADLVSEGNMALLRAVDKFDAARGFKFSTYACRAILKAFSRAGVKLSKYRGLFPTDFDPKLERSDFLDRRRAGHRDDCVEEIADIVKDNRADLTDIEQEVIQHRFALSRKREQEPEAQPLTLEQVGKIIGVTKERVRQIQNKALDKIRHSLETGFLG